MKVDKAVCTDTYEDLSRAIRFEAVFSTLVENKILAIKRECELKKRNKKSRVIRRILFGRKSCKKVGKWGGGSDSGKKKNGTVKDGEKDSEGGGGDEGGGNVGAIGGLPLVENSTTSDGVDEVIVEIGDLSSLVDADGNVVAVDTGDDYPSKSESEVGGDRRATRPEHSVTAVNLELGNEEDSGGEAFGETDDLPSKSEAIAQSLEYDRKSIKSNDIRIRERCNTLDPVSVSIEIEPHSDPLSTQYDIEDSATNVSIELDVSEISDMKRSIASEPVPIIKNVSRYRPGTSRQPSLLGMASHRLRVLEAKSISAQNSPILPRQKSTEARHLTFSTATYQTTSPNPVATKSKKDIEDTSFVIDLSRENADDNVSATSNLSNCNSIVIPKDKQPTLGDSKRSSSHKKSPLAVVGDSSSSTSASRKNKLIPTSTTTAMTTTAKLLYSADPSPPPTPGLIESFNQLTSPNLPPVISMRQSASPVSDMIKLHRLSAAGGGGRSTAAQAQTQQPHSQEFSNPSTKMTTTIITSNELGSRKQRHGFLRQSSCDVEMHYQQQQQQQRQPDEVRHSSRHSRRETFGAHRAMSSAAAVQHSGGFGMIGYDDYGDDPLMAAGELNESDEEKLNKRKYKYLKRCSDPVIVFPSTSTGGGGGPSGGGSGLQHCILSRPPNQPIQFPYDEDFMYDVSLQLEPDRHGELDSIVPEHRRRHKHRHHHHHRHCKKKRHKKRKILVHDLDDQSVKVIDPDDLPQRARWTIIATAFLLLIMCLLLVGITLRMAPIIDDMVRQENERLMRESLDRAKMIKNYTEYNRMIGGDEIP
ncbi:uncharacterized protein LOC109426613 isoform X1 [Aedes albopictus]|uniref:Uncharacterized protein n=1 Tax=Aedes albopictus TaxID=7160 RepID=A0ABM1XL43_AEDAL|nr:uncharacterized protein LOC109426613 isoform X2 [Aedes albopictus]